MKPLVSMCVALALAVLPVAASAQVTQTYQYDANGRLTGVTTTGPAGTNTAVYVYDDADNRTSRSQTGTTAYAMLSPREAYSGLWSFPFFGEAQGLTFDTFTLVFEDIGDLVPDGWAEMGPNYCIGTEFSVSRWPQAHTDLVSREPAGAVFWRSHPSAIVNAESPDGAREQTTSTGGPTPWPARTDDEGCSS